MVIKKNRLEKIELFIERYPGRALGRMITVTSGRQLHHTDVRYEKPFVQWERIRIPVQKYIKRKQKEIPPFDPRMHYRKRW